jgi:catechol 2,3-dioxygenase-like lactoylglutathione lyase family enzyme
MIQATGVDHVVLHVNDLQGSKKFYTEILGMIPYREDEGQVFLHAGRQGVALFKRGRRYPANGRQRSQPSRSQRRGGNVYYAQG